MSAADVPVCAGRGSQPRCKYCRINGSEPAVYWCTALYNVVTGEALLRDCAAVRGDQMACGRDGKLYEPVASRVPTRGGDVMGVERALLNAGRASREDLG